MQRPNDLDLCAVEGLPNFFFVISILAKILALTIIRSSTRLCASIIPLRHLLRHATIVWAYQRIASLNFAYFAMSSPVYLATDVAFVVVAFP